MKFRHLLCWSGASCQNTVDSGCFCARVRHKLCVSESVPSERLTLEASCRVAERGSFAAWDYHIGSLSKNTKPRLKRKSPTTNGATPERVPFAHRKKRHRELSRDGNQIRIESKRGRAKITRELSKATKLALSKLDAERTLSERGSGRNVA